MGSALDVPGQIDIALMAELLRTSELHHRGKSSDDRRCARRIAFLCLDEFGAEAEHPCADAVKRNADCQRTKIEASRGPFHELRESDLEDR